MPSGIILKGIGGFYYVSTPEGVYECKARGIFRKNDLTPLPGDRVIFTVTDELKKKGSMDEIQPRDSELVRPAVANVNQVVIVVSIKSPEPDLLLLDKLLVTAEMKNIGIIICINKIDLASEDEYGKLSGTYTRAGYKVILSSSKLQMRLEDLREALAGRISVFAGQSGVGKSTILNRILNSQVMQTGDISERIDRGKHTTRHAELVELDSGGYLVDTPGFSSFELGDIQHDELQLYYPEFRDHITGCRFTRCSHVSEPDCKVKEAMEQELIDRKRHERYAVLYDILKQRKDDYRGKTKGERKK